MKAVFTFITVFFSLIVIGQDYPNYLNASTVTTISYWEMGDERVYRVTASEEKQKGTKTQNAKEDVSYDITLQVVRQADSFYVIEMTYSNYKIPAEVAQMELLKEIIEISNGQKIRYKINELGQFITILNKVELVKSLKTQMNILKEKLKTAYPENEEIKKYLSTSISSFEQKFLKVENIDALYSVDLMMLHGMYGFELKLNENLEIETEYMVMNNVEVNGEGKLRLNSINKSTDNFHFTVVERPNKEQLSKYLNQILAVFTAELPSDEVKDMEFNYDVKTSTKYAMELSTGWLISVNMAQSIEMTVNKETSKVTKKRSLVAL